MSAFLFDLRSAIRSIRKNSFGGVVIVTLALGIGANTALFSVANAVLLKPLPYRDPGTLVAVHETNVAQGGDRVPVSAPSFLAWNKQDRRVAQLAAFRSWGFVLTGSGEPERLAGARASSELLPLLGLEPIAGRRFSTGDDQFGAPKVAMLGEGLWRRRFGANPAVVGTSIVLNGERHSVIGVLPRDTTLSSAEVFVPLALEPFTLQQRGTRALTVIGRLAAGATPADARADLRLASDDVAKQFPDASAGWDVVVTPLAEHLVGSIRPTVLMVWTAVALVLLIACANTANLLLARAAQREHEVVVCAALGASRARLLRRLLSESVLLGILGGAAGLPIALAMLQAFASMSPAGVPRLDTVRLDLSVFAFTMILSVATGIVFGLAPALRALTPHPASILRETSSSFLGGGVRSVLRDAGLAFQVALAVVVLITAGLLVRSFERLLAVDPGFEPGGVMTMTMAPGNAKYGDNARRAAFYQDVATRLESIHGVDGVGFVSHLPLAGRPLTVDVTVEGRAPAPGAPTFMADNMAVSPGYFKALRIPLGRGRFIAESDAAAGAPVVVINEEMARRLWSGEDPIGRRIVLGAATGADPRPREIVGVAGDVRAVGLDTRPSLQIYIPLAQNPWPTMTLAVRASGDVAAIAPAIRTELLALDPDQPAYNVRSFEEVVSRALALRRFQMVVLVVFALIGLVLATIGVYSVVACTVRLRTREIGLRVALGAPRMSVLRMAVGHSLIWASAGIVAGSMAALGAGRFVGGLLFGVAPADPLTFAAVIAFTAAVVLIGSALAGRRAVGMDPLRALRQD